MLFCVSLHIRLPHEHHGHQMRDFPQGLWIQCLIQLLDSSLGLGPLIKHISWFPLQAALKRTVVILQKSTRVKQRKSRRNTCMLLNVLKQKCRGVDSIIFKAHQSGSPESGIRLGHTTWQLRSQRILTGSCQQSSLSAGHACRAQG